MNAYVKINNVKYSIVQYSYRLNSVNTNTQVSHLFSCTVVTDASNIIIKGDQIEFYVDDVLIYSDPINTVIQNNTRFAITSEKTINAVATKSVTIHDVITYSSTSMRIIYNFDILPLDSVVTPFGIFIAQTITNYKTFSEIRYG